MVVASNDRTSQKGSNFESAAVCLLSVMFSSEVSGRTKMTEMFRLD